jgi:hypothetical protein
MDLALLAAFWLIVTALISLFRARHPKPVLDPPEAHGPVADRRACRVELDA